MPERRSLIIAGERRDQRIPELIRRGVIEALRREHRGSRPNASLLEVLARNHTPMV
jgi:hypothetical protein